VPDAFLPILALAVFASAAGFLAGRYLWPHRPGRPSGTVSRRVDTTAVDQVATSRAPTARDTTTPPAPHQPAGVAERTVRLPDGGLGTEDLEPVLSTVERRLHESESELERLRAAIRQRPAPAPHRRSGDADPQQPSAG
jgi:hypothetical protein